MSTPEFECCDEMRENRCAFSFDWVIGSGYDNDTINLSTCEDHWYELQDVKFCPFCGVKLK